MNSNARSAIGPERRRYEVLADEITRQITAGVLRPGDRLPSVRQVCASRQLSPFTISRAYHLLESRGLIRAAPRSGYFVKPRAAIPAPEPETWSPHEGAYPVAISDLVMENLNALRSPDVVPLGTLFPSPTLYPLEALRRSMSSALRRLDAWSTLEDMPPGNERLRRLIAKRYLLHGVNVDVDEIVLTNGALEALHLCLHSVTTAGDAVIVESPCFYPALLALERLRLKAIEVATDPREGVDLSALARIIEQQRPKACWLMTNFQNPMGCLLPGAKKRALVELLTRYGVPLIEDDVYGELYFGPEPPEATKLFDQCGMVMHCSSFSKTLAPGYGVGWVAAGRFANDVRRQKLMISLSGSVPAQNALADYLQNGNYDNHLRRLRKALQTQQTALVDAVTRHFPPGTRVTRPQGGYFVWVDMPWECLGTLKLRAAALEHHITIAPGPLFSNHGEFLHCLRLNTGYPWSPKTERAIETLARLAHNARVTV